MSEGARVEPELRGPPEQADALDALRQSEERFRMLADNISQLAWTCDLLGNVTWYNKRWLEYTGLSFEEMKGWGWSKVQHPDHVDRVVTRVQRSAETGEPWEDTFPLRGRDGQYRWFLSRAMPIRDENGSFVQWFGTNTDVTEQVLAEEKVAQQARELRALNDRLQELDRAKTAFFSNVSHEFRTPLTLMLGPIEELLARDGDGLAPPARGQLQVVHRSGLRMLRLVNSLLDFSRIEADRVRAVYAPTDLAQVTIDLASSFRSACERAGLRLLVDCPPLSEPVFVDRDMWEKIVLNLLSNAFKFTFAGEIAVSLRQCGGTVELEVRDSGTGIPAEELPRLFERFHRVENARGRTHEGTGIGLALVQELVKLHGGSIAVDSALGRGTTFVVSVPLGSAHFAADQIGPVLTPSSTMTMRTLGYVQEALRWLPDVEIGGDDRAHPGDPELAEVHAEADGEKVHARERVLVVEDNADMRDYLFGLLAESFEVETVHDGEAALAAARERLPDLVLTDVMMPRLDGFGLLSAMRSDPATRDVPVIMLSARAGEESRVEGMDAGADDYLVKPFHARELRARVAAHLRMARLRREAAESQRRDEERAAADLHAMTLLQDIGARCARPGADLHECLDAIVDTAIALTGADKGNMQLFDPGSRALVLTAARGFDERFLTFFAKVAREDSSVCGAAMQQGSRAVVPDVTQSPILAGTPALEVLLEAGVRAVQSTPLVSSAGRLLGMISTHHGRPQLLSERVYRFIDLLARQAADFLERRESEQLLREEDRRKNEFLAMLAHELRGPLAPIRNSLEIMRRADGDGEAVRQARGALERQFSSMARLVDDMLDLSRIKHGTLALRPERVDLQSILYQATETCRPLADTLGHEIVLTVPRQPLYLFVDPVRLSQVFGNLLHNACKYTEPKGRIWLTADTNGGEVVVRVKDTGIGIPADQLDRIFEMFVQVDKTLDRAHGGLGIGLTLVKRLVELHGGTVTVRSEGPGAGSEFAVRLPILETGDEEPRRVPAPRAEPTMPRRILVVDDNRDAAASLAALLRITGHVTETANDGIQALRSATSLRPEIILLDLGLPGMSGYDVCRAVRDEPWGKEVLIVALTGWGQDEDRRKSREAGFDHHLVKPVDYEALARLL